MNTRNVYYVRWKEVVSGNEFKYGFSRPYEFSSDARFGAMLKKKDPGVTEVEIIKVAEYHDGEGWKLDTTVKEEHIN